MSEFNLPQWSAFFAAEVGAAAALAGLVIVAISINVARILGHPALPGRAAETLIAPTGILIVSSYGLVPVQHAATLGGELIAVGLAMWLAPAIIQIRNRHYITRRRVFLRVFLSQASSLPIIAAGAMMLAHNPDALYWLVPGVTFSLIATVINAWVLLVEILR